MKVIFHGDDFGLTPGINRGIMRGFSEGLLTSASIVASGEAAQEAISLARETPELDMGLHLTLSDERPLLPPQYLPSLVASGGRFPSRRHLLKALLLRAIDLKEVEDEWRAQAETILNRGIHLSHLDSHQFIHLFPGLLRVCLKMVRDYDIPFVRAAMVDRLCLRPGLRRLIQWTGLALWSRCYAWPLLAPSVRTIPSTGFLWAGGRWTRHTLLHALAHLESHSSMTTVEVILHPGTGDAHTRHTYRHWGYDWKSDLDLLTDKALRQDLACRRIHTTSFGKER